MNGKLLLSAIILLASSAVNVVTAADLSAENNGQDTTSQIEQGQCGILSLYQKPPETKDTYFASINMIDGQTVNSNSTRFALSPGIHQIKIFEMINNPYFTRRRGEMKNFKYIELKVEENKQYALGAKFIRKNRSKLTTGEYWQPVVWKTTEVDCKL